MSICVGETRLKNENKVILINEQKQNEHFLEDEESLYGKQS